MVRAHVSARLRQGPELRRQLDRVGQRRPCANREMSEPTAAPVRKPSHIVGTWIGDRRFETGRLHGPHALIDGDGHVGQSPPDALLSALITCAGIDLVDYLAKR